MKVFLFFLLVASSLSSSQKAENLLQKAERNFQEKRFEEAVRLYEEYLIFWPEAEGSPKAQFQKGESLFQLNRFKEAIASFKKTADLYPLSNYAPLALLRIGDAYYRMGDHKNALKSYEEVIKKAPQTKEAEEAKLKLPERATSKEEFAALQLAKKLYEERQWEEAYKSFVKFAQDYPKSSYLAYAKLKSGESLYQQKKFEEALTFYKDILANHPETEYAPYAHYTLAWSYYKLGKLKEASKEILSFLEKYPTSPYQQSAVKLKDKIEAQLKPEPSEKAIAQAPEANYAEPAKKKMAEGRTGLLEDEIKRGFEIAMNYYELGDYKEAIERLERIMTKYPESAYAKKAKTMLNNLSSYAEERKACELFKTAQAYLEKNDYDQAFAEFKKIVELYPQTRYAKTAVVIMAEINQKLVNEEAKKILSSARDLSFQKEYLKAIEKYDEIILTYPTSYWVPYALYGKGESYYESGDYQSAALEWEGLVLRFPDSDLAPHSLYHLADSLLKLNREAEAVETYRKLLLSYPESIYGKGEIRSLLEKKIKSLEAR